MLCPRLHVCDYITQNSPADMSFRAGALQIQAEHYIYNNHKRRLPEDRLHFDLFAGCRNMQRFYCGDLGPDLSRLLQDPRPNRNTWLAVHSGEAGFKRILGSVKDSPASGTPLQHTMSLHERLK